MPFAIVGHVDWNWGTVPDWLSAAGTVGAVVVALVVSRRDGKRLTEERQEAERDRELFRAQQAAQAEALKRQLAAKVSVVTETMHMMNNERAIQWKVHNAAEEPISMVSLVQRRQGFGAQPSRTTAEVIKTWPLIEAGGRREWTSPVIGDPAQYDPEREVHFRDGAGHAWLRTAFGRLQLVDPDGPESIGMVLLPL